MFFSIHFMPLFLFCMFDFWLCMFVICFVYCVFVLFYVLFLLLFIAVSFLFLYKFTNHCDQVETHLQ